MTSPPAERSRRETHAAMVSLLLAVALLAIKFIAYLLTDSSAIFSDAVESIVNVLAAALAWYSVVLAHRPADADHPYGHGKVEFVSAGFEGGMMLLAALVMVLHAIEQLVNGVHIDVANIRIGLSLMFFAMLINGAMGIFLTRSGRRGGSIALEADGKHLLADAVTSAVVLVALLMVMLTKWKFSDPLAAILVAIWVATEAIKLMRRSAAGLMDEQDSADDKLLRQILDSHVGASARQPRICSYHKLRHRHSGRYHWVDFHIMVPKTLNVEQGHEIASAIEYEIEKALGEGNATAHVEPCATEGCAPCSRV